MSARLAKVAIKGARWVVRRFTQKTFRKRHGDLYAVTDPTLRKIAFQDGHLDLPIVRHEVRHAFTSELCLNDDTLTTTELEEVQCTLDERHWDDMDKVSREIFRVLS